MLSSFPLSHLVLGILCLAAMTVCHLEESNYPPKFPAIAIIPSAIVASVLFCLGNQQTKHVIMS